MRWRRAGTVCPAALAITALLSLGLAPAPASASVHAAEGGTTGISGLAHWGFGNVDRRLFRGLVVPGILCGGLGASLPTALPGEAVRPFVSACLLARGALILRKAGRGPQRRARSRGGSARSAAAWTRSAAAGGRSSPPPCTGAAAPRHAIGSANAAEFFVTAAASATFVATIGLTHLRVVAGLVAGGALAAPFTTYATRHLPEWPLMILVGALVVLLSARGLAQALG